MGQAFRNYIDAARNIHISYCNPYTYTKIRIKMDRHIKLSEFFITVAAFIISFVVIMWNRATKEGVYIQRQEDISMKYNQLSSEFNEFKQHSEKREQDLLFKIDRLADQNTNILILLQNKQDRRR